MFLKRYKISVLATLTIFTSLLIGCSSNSNTGSNSSIEKSELLKNQEFRTAVHLALDKESLVNDYLGVGFEELQGFIPADFAFDLEGNDYRDVAGDIKFEHDDDLAKESWGKLKKELNFNEVELSLIASEGSGMEEGVKFIKKELEETLDGLTINIEFVPFEERYEREDAGEFDITLSGWAPDYPDPSTYLDIFVTGAMCSEQASYSNSKFDEFIKNAKNATTTDESWENYIKSEQTLIEDGITIPIAGSSAQTLKKSYVKHLANYTSGAEVSYKWASLENGKKEIKVYESTKPLITLDSTEAIDVGSFNYINDIFEGLLRIDEEGVITPGIAETYQMSADGMTWTFNLRKDSLWSNGENVTANDFKYAWEKLLNPENDAVYSFILYDIEGAEDYDTGATSDFSQVGVKVLDDYTLEVKLNRPVVYFDKLTAFPSLFPVNQNAYEKYGDEYGKTVETTVFNGPFKLQSMNENENVMIKNQDYWDKDSVILEKIFLYNKTMEKDESIKKYENGEFDIINLINEDVAKYKEHPDFNERKDGSVFFLLFNVK